MKTIITIEQSNTLPAKPKSYTQQSCNFLGHEIRIIMIDDEPWFVAVDVCNAIGIGNSRMAIQKLDKDEVMQVIDSNTVNLTDGSKINNLLNVVSESGMYMLVMRSRDAVKAGTQAHKFRKWVTAEVLPAIRKTGTYTPPAVYIDKYDLSAIRHDIKALSDSFKASNSVNSAITSRLMLEFGVQNLKYILKEDYEKALEFIGNEKWGRVAFIRSVLHDAEKMLVKEILTDSAPHYRKLKSRYSDYFKGLLPEDRVNWRRLAARDYYSEFVDANPNHDPVKSKAVAQLLAEI